MELGKMSIFVVICGLIATVDSSAIPMWEFLTQNEKVMYLFNTFQLQVQDYCKSDSCKQDLKNFGWKKLKEMTEDDLDKMDPFQRNSNDIIWESVMEGHPSILPQPHQPPSSSSSTSNAPSSTPKPNSYEDYQESEPEGEESARIETVISKVPPPKGFHQVIVGSGSPEYKNRFSIPNYSSNKIQETTTEEVIKNNEERVPLQGPWAVKVHRDGSPVIGGESVVPEDDDLRLYQMTKVAFQNL